MKLVSQKEVYKKGSIILTEKVFRSGDKEITRVSLSLGKNTVLIIPIGRDGNFYLGQQKRADNSNSVLEFPNGGIEKDERELDAAKRELSEELGLEGDMEYLGEFRPFDNLVDLKVTVFICRNAEVQDDVIRLRPDFYEKIERKRFNEKEIYNLIKEGKIKHSYFLSALSLYNSQN
ncbi:MAG TPA: NUDIX hydrolase [Patescibacteria group bacterium]